MSGLLLRELQLRGLAERILIVAPSNLTFQWQRELREKFDQSFVVLKGAELRHDAADVRRHRPDPATEMTAMRTAMAHEEAQGAPWVEVRKVQHYYLDVEKLSAASDGRTDR